MGKGRALKRGANVSFPNIRFECTLCGKCCIQDDRNRRQIFLTEKDVKAISSMTGIKIEDFSDKNSSKNYPFIMKLIKGRCFFLGPFEECRIYPIRPLVCRFYPFTMNKFNGKYMFHVDPSCPGLGKGDYLDREYFEGLVEEAERSFGIRAL
ncbi:MAG: YkgJ family cysteine cluster protein [Thermoproteota archaeon]